MNALVRISLVAILTGVWVIASAQPLEEIENVPSKYKNLFVFKADQEFVGATVQVFYSNGDLVTSHTLQKRKMIIDFCDVKFGEYTIRVVKGGKKQEFYYVKK